MNKLLLFHKSLSLSAAFLVAASCVVSAQESASSQNRFDDIKQAVTTEQKDGQRKVTITRLPMEEGEAYLEELARVEKAKKEVLKVQAHQRATARSSETPLTQKSFVVSATIFEDKTSLLRCWSTDGGQALTVHSNCNWNIFMGQQTFQDRDTQYSFILLPGTASSSSENADSNVPNGAPKGLPAIRQSGAKYMVIEGTEQDEILDFLEAVHQRYDREKRTLIRAHRQQKRKARQRAHRLRVNPPKPKDVVIRFGRRDLSKEITNSNQKGK